MFSQACVIPSVQGVWGVGFPACITGHMTRGSASRGCASRGSAFRGRGFCIQGVGQTRPPPALQDTVNKRAVRILLECSFVYFADNRCSGQQVKRVLDSCEDHPGPHLHRHVYPCYDSHSTLQKW